MAPSAFGNRKISALELALLGEKRRFHVFDEKFQIENSRRILQGRKYPVPPLDRHGVDGVFDIGANIGAASVFFAAAYPNARIHAFEPNRLSAPLLQRNIAGIERIAFHAYGLSDRDCETAIRIAGSGGGASSVKAAIRPVATHRVALRDAGPCLGGLAQGMARILLKVDTEGCDAEILERIADLYPRVQAVYVEYHSEAQRRRIDRVLTGHGMLLFGAIAPHPHRGDLYYLREDIVAARPELDRFRCD